MSLYGYVFALEIMYTISPILHRIVSSSQYTIFFWKFLKKIFWPGRNCFLVTCSLVFVSDYFGIYLSNADLIFLTNMISTGEPVEGVFRFSVIRYTCRNCCKALSVGVPCAFLSALFSVSTNLSAWPFNLGRYCGVVTCLTWNVLQKSLEFSRYKLCAIVTGDTVWHSESCEQFMQEPDSYGGCRPRAS